MYIQHDMTCNRLLIVFLNLDVGRQGFCELPCSQLRGEKSVEKANWFFCGFASQPLAFSHRMYLQPSNQTESRD
jgi:hypothetical protein